MPIINAQQLRQQFQSGQQVVVGVIGNSIGCGYRANNWQSIQIDATGMTTVANQNNASVGGWSQQLQVWLKNKNSTSIVHNMSGSGWTTKDHIDKNTVGLMAAKTPKPVAVFVPLQVNDRLKDDGSVSGGITWSQYLANTRTIIRGLISNGILPILVKENNEPMPGGSGWYWSDYARMGAVTPGNGVHRAYSEYIGAVDTISQDSEWVASLGHTVDVVDSYTPTLNMGQESQYRYQYENGTYDNSANGLAPLDFRFGLMNGWIPGYVNDVWHPNQSGHDIILATYQTWLSKIDNPLTFTAQPTVASPTDDGAVVAYGTADPVADDVTASATGAATVTATATLRDASAALVTAGISAADVNRMVESLTVIVGVDVVANSVLQSVESVRADIDAFPTVSDLLNLASGITAPFAWSAQPTLASGTPDGGVISYSTYDTGFDDVATSADVTVQVAELLAKVDNLLTTVEAVPSVADLLAQVESITTTAQATTETIDVKLAGVAESLLSATDAITTLTDLQMMVNGVTTLANSGADALTICAMLDNLTTAAHAQTSVVDAIGMLFGRHEVVLLMSPLTQTVFGYSPITRKVTLNGTLGAT